MPTFIPRSILNRVLCFPLLGLWFVPSGAGARQYPESGQLLFQGRPGPYCQSFLVTEAAPLVRLDHGSQRNHMGNFYVVADIGAMKNLGRNHAVGATGFIGVGDRKTLGGVKARYRRWLTDRLSLDFSPGVILGGKESPYRLRGPGGVAHVSLTYRDLVGITTQVEVVGVEHDQTGEKSTDVAVYTGARFGSYGTLAAAAAGLLFVAARGLAFLAGS